MYNNDMRQKLKLFRYFFCKTFCHKTHTKCAKHCYIKNLNIYNANDFEIRDLFENGYDEKWHDMKWYCTDIKE